MHFVCPYTHQCQCDGGCGGVWSYCWAGAAEDLSQILGAKWATL